MRLETLFSKQAILNRTKGDSIIWSIVIVLSLISLIAIYSSTGSLAYRMTGGHPEVYLVKRFGILIIGFFIIFAAHSVNYKVYRRFATAMLIVSALLLLYTLFFGVTLNAGSRWIKIPGVGVTFQTSDLAKLSLFVYLSAQLSSMQNNRGDFKQVCLRIFLPCLVICGLIAMANLSTALIIAACCGMLFFIGRIQFSYLLILGGALVILLLGVYNFSNRAATWKHRIEAFAAGADVEDGFQVKLGKVAIANGGVFGRGAGNSTQRNFLPHSYSDYIYSIIIEEYGLIGGSFVLLLYLLFLWRSIVIFRRCPYAFGAFLAVGLSFTLVFQALINMGVNVNLLPVTGLTLPLISKGGSSVWFTCLTIGIILSVSRFVNEMEGKKSKSKING